MSTDKRKVNLAHVLCNPPFPHSELARIRLISLLLVRVASSDSSICAVQITLPLITRNPYDAQITMNRTYTNKGYQSNQHKQDGDDLRVHLLDQQQQ